MFVESKHDYSILTRTQLKANPNIRKELKKEKHTNKQIPGWVAEADANTGKQVPTRAPMSRSPLALGNLRGVALHRLGAEVDGPALFCGFVGMHHELCD